MVTHNKIAHIQEKFPDIEVLPADLTVSALAQQSIRCILCIYRHECTSNFFCFTRSVQVPDAHVGLSLKLALGLKLTRYVRTMPPEKAHIGSILSAQVIPHLKLDPNINLLLSLLRSWPV